MSADNDGFGRFAGRYVCRRPNGDVKVVDLLEGGGIGEGADNLVRRWIVTSTGGRMRLAVMSSTGETTFVAFQENETQWSGEVFRAGGGSISVELIAQSSSSTSEPSLIVGIPTLLRYDLLEQCINTVLSGSLVPTAIYVVDNGGRWTGHASPLVHVIRPTSNLGVARSWNVLRRICPSEELVLLNDDALVGEDTLRRMSDCTAGCVFSGPASENKLVFNSCGFACVLIRRWAYRLVGDFDEEFWPAYHEDMDYWYRLNLAGVSVGVAGDRGVRHIGSQTKAAMDADGKRMINEHWKKGLSYYCSKWGGPPLSEVYMNPFNATRVVIGRS